MHTIELRDKFKCCIDKINQYKMSDFLNFAQYYSPALFYGLLLGDPEYYSINQR